MEVRQTQRAEWRHPIIRVTPSIAGKTDGPQPLPACGIPVNEPARIRISIERRRVNLLPVIFVALAVAIFLRYPLGLLMLAVRLGFH